MADCLPRPPSAVFSDFDGTFLARDKTIPPRNLAAVAELGRRGIPFVPATGRPLSGIPAELWELPGVRYLILTNGTTIFDKAGRGRHLLADGLEATGDFIYRRPMDPAVFRRVYERLAPLPISIDLFADGRAFAERARLDALSDFGIEANLLAQIRRSRTAVDGTLLDVLEGVRFVERMSFYYRTEAEREAVEAVIDAEPSLCRTSSELTNIEVMAAGASKAEALLWLCAHLGLDPGRTIAFGDGGNDRAMLEAAGWGVALADAQAGVAACADDVTRLGCSEGGLGDYLLDVLGSRSWMGGGGIGTAHARILFL